MPKPKLVRFSRQAIDRYGSGPLQRPARSLKKLSMLLVEDMGDGMAHLELSKRLPRSVAEQIVGMLEGHRLTQTSRPRHEGAAQDDFMASSDPCEAPT